MRGAIETTLSAFLRWEIDTRVSFVQIISSRPARLEGAAMLCESACGSLAYTAYLANALDSWLLAQQVASSFLINNSKVEDFEGKYKQFL